MNMNEKEHKNRASGTMAEHAPPRSRTPALGSPAGRCARAPGPGGRARTPGSCRRIFRPATRRQPLGVASPYDQDVARHPPPVSSPVLVQTARENKVSERSEEKDKTQIKKRSERAETSGGDRVDKEREKLHVSEDPWVSVRVEAMAGTNDDPLILGVKVCTRDVPYEFFSTRGRIHPVLMLPSVPRGKITIPM